MTELSYASGGRAEKFAVRADAKRLQTETIAVMDYSTTESRQAAVSKTPGSASNPAARQDESSDQFVARVMARTCDEVAALHLEIRRWQEATGQNQFADIYDSQPDLRDALSYYVTPGGNFWYATTSTGDLAGFVGLMNTGNGTGSVKRLAVAPRYQGRGVGNRLMAELMDWAQRSGFCELHLSTGVDERAKGIYKWHGFVDIEFDEQNRNYLMGCTLRKRGSVGRRRSARDAEVCDICYGLTMSRITTTRDGATVTICGDCAHYRGIGR